MNTNDCAMSFSMTLSYLYGKLQKKLQGTCVLNSDVDSTSKVGTSCNIINCVMGRHSYISHDSTFVGTEIGAFCSISDHVNCGDAQHPVAWLSTSPVFQNVKHSGVKARFARLDLPPQKHTIIGNDVWIGHDVIIKQGAKIGNGAVIGAGAVVTKDVPDYAIVGGVPAKIIRYRFDEETIKAMLASKWWDWEDDRLKEIAQYADNKEKYMDYIYNYLKTRELVGGGGGSPL